MPDPDTAHPGFLENYTLFLMAVASAQVSRSFHEIAAAQGLSVAEWRVLACLHDLGSASVSELARLSLLEQSRLTHMIGRIQNRWLVLRQRSNRNRRSVLVRLTDEGARLAADLVAQAKAHERQAVTDKLGRADTEKLHEILRKLIGHPPV